MTTVKKDTGEASRYSLTELRLLLMRDGPPTEKDADDRSFPFPVISTQRYRMFPVQQSVYRRRASTTSSYFSALATRNRKYDEDMCALENEMQTQAGSQQRIFGRGVMYYRG